MSPDGVSECSATPDDSVSEEEEESSFDELSDVTPYLQPGVELSVLNEVKLVTLQCWHFQLKCVENCRKMYLVINTPHENVLSMCVFKMFGTGPQNKQPLQCRHNLTCETWT